MKPVQKTHGSSNERQRTWSVGSYTGGVGSGAERRAGLQLGVRELRQVCHDAELVYLGVDHLIRLDQL